MCIKGVEMSDKTKEEIKAKIREMYFMFPKEKYTLNEAFEVVASLFYSLVNEIIERIDSGEITDDKKYKKKLQLLLTILASFNEKKDK